MKKIKLKVQIYFKYLNGDIYYHFFDGSKKIMTVNTWFGQYWQMTIKIWQLVGHKILFMATKNRCNFSHFYLSSQSSLKAFERINIKDRKKIKFHNHHTQNSRLSSETAILTNIYCLCWDLVHLWILYKFEDKYNYKITRWASSDDGRWEACLRQ